MMPLIAVAQNRWTALERGAFGLIYGAIMVLSLLIALDNQVRSPVAMAIILFGSILAISLARMRLLSTHRLMLLTQASEMLGEIFGPSSLYPPQ
jgi:hypothetical protein